MEHTNINPNKAAHIGHLRNAVLGDTLVRCLRRLGRRVEVQNYVDDTGVQVADVVVGFLYLPEEELAAVAAPVWPRSVAVDRRARAPRSCWVRGPRGAGTLVAPELGAADFDDLCWELYPRVTRRYEEDPEFDRAPRRGAARASRAASPPTSPSPTPSIASSWRAAADRRPPDP